MSEVNALYQSHITYELEILKNQNTEVLDTEKIHRKILAFLSDLGKVSEESGCIRFWDTNTIDQEAVLEYYVDALQLLLSIGFELHVESLKQFPELQEETSIMNQFLKIYNTTLQLQKTYHFNDYQNIIDDYFALGFLLGFNIQTITNAYKEIL